MRGKRALAAILCAVMFFSSNSFCVETYAAENTNGRTEIINAVNETAASSLSPGAESNIKEELDPVTSEEPENDTTGDEENGDMPEMSATPTHTAQITPGSEEKPSELPMQTEEPLTTSAPTESPSATPGNTEEPTAIPEETISPEPTEEPSKTPEPTMAESPTTVLENKESIPSTEIEIQASSADYFTVEDGKLCLKPGMELKGIISIPDAAKTIPADIFKNKSGITKVTFSEDSMLTTIEEGAFEGCSLTEIEIPDGVTEIKNYTFKNSSLQKIVFKGDVETIGTEAFMNTGLSSFQAPVTMKK